jgi:hypothetical protein
MADRHPPRHSHHCNSKAKGTRPLMGRLGGVNLSQYSKFCGMRSSVSHSTEAHADRCARKRASTSSMFEISEVRIRKPLNG